MSIENEELLPPERSRWDECTPAERVSAGWQMTKAFYKAKGLYVEGQPFDRTAVHRMTREKWIKAEEERF